MQMSSWMEETHGVGSDASVPMELGMQLSSILGDLFKNLHCSGF